MRLLAVDGNSIVNRAFYGIRPLTTKDGCTKLKMKKIPTPWRLPLT